jgi:glycosyltransferase involved in cell wall biosynthesis
VTDRRVRVGVNLLWLVPGVVGGSEEYATRVLGALADPASDDIELVLFTLRPFADAHPTLAARCTTVTAPIDGSNKALRVAFESTWLPREMRRRRIDVVHHLGGRMPLVSRSPSVVTIHDLQPLDHPQNFSAVKRRFLARALPRTARRADVVVTPSEFVRRGVVARLGVADAQAMVVAAPVPAPAAAAVADVAPALAGGASYFLYPAITYAHKNHATLIDAFARVVVDRPGVRLLLTGGPGPCEADVRAQIHRLGLDDAVVRTGRLPHAELDRLLQHAVALVFPSRYEGFGLPVVEAMVSGCPVIASDATALPEVLGDAGALVAPDDVDGWRKAMEQQLDADRDLAGARGRARAARYDATSCVDAQRRAYERAVSRARVG